MIFPFEDQGIYTDETGDHLHQPEERHYEHKQPQDCDGHRHQGPSPAHRWSVKPPQELVVKQRPCGRRRIFDLTCGYAYYRSSTRTTRKKTA